MLLPDDTLSQAAADTYRNLIIGAEQQGIGMLTASESPDAAALVQAVANVAHRITVAAGVEGQRAWDVVILKSSTRNALVLPNGKIVIFLGLLNTIQNDAQLAAVIGHEVAHLVARHAAERLSHLLAAQAALTVADVALPNSEYRPLIGAALGAGIEYGVLLPYNRAHESEADRIGLFYMAKAGYDPLEAIALWERLALAADTGLWEFLRTHPSDATRARQIEGWLPEAMLYFADPARPLPSNLVEVRQALGERESASRESPLGLRPEREPGFWYKVSMSNSKQVDTWRVDAIEPCSDYNCVFYSSDAGSKGVLTEDGALVEVTLGDGTSARFDPPLQAFRWPLRVGQSWAGISTLTSGGGRTEVHWKVDIVSWEPVVVPAGSFMAFRLILSLNGSRFQESWWAPEARAAVRAVNPDGRGGEVIAELVDYEESLDPSGQLSAQ